MTNTRKAAQAYADFTGHKPSRVKSAKLDSSDVQGWKIGDAVGVAYRATRDGETKQYFHEFSKKAAPELVSRDDGKQLYFTGGSYKVTDRGIEDMPQLFVVNPSPRAGRSKTRKAPMRRRRTATRRRATRQVAVFRANPVRRRRRRATRRRAGMFTANPVRRTARRRRTGLRMRRNPVRRMRRNPSMRGVTGGLSKMLIPAMGIGAGAVGSEILMGYLPIPANFKTGVLRHVTKGAVGVAAGLLIGKIFKMKRVGYYFAAGAVAIATHDALKELIAARAGGLNQSGFGAYVPRLPSQFKRPGMGYVNPAAVTRMGQYVKPLPSQFGGMGGDAPVFAHPGGETGFVA